MQIVINVDVPFMYGGKLTDQACPCVFRSMTESVFIFHFF